MSSSVPAPKEENTYISDVENGGELSRLVKQGRLITKALGGLFPQQLDISPVHTALDIACGPGEWVLAVAEAYPTMSVTGIDISNTVIQFVQSISGNLPNVHFQTANILKPFDFADASFDLIHSRFIFSFVPAALWPTLLQECYRVLCPGGVMLLTECEMAITTSPAIEQLTRFFTQALKVAGQSFSPDGYHIGITPMLSRLLTNAQFGKRQHEAHALECSAGTKFHKDMIDDYQVAFHLMQPFIIKMGITTPMEYETLYHQMLREIQSKDFCAVSYLFSAWGYKGSQRA